MGRTSILESQRTLEPTRTRQINHIYTPFLDSQTQKIYINNMSDSKYKKILRTITLGGIGAIMGVVAGCSQGEGYNSQSTFNPDSELIIPSDTITGQAIQDEQPPINSDGIQDLGQEGQLPTQFIITEPTDKTPVTRQTMVGAWTVSALDESCQMFLALTKWTKGFRAASRGCSAPVLTSMAAWDVSDDRVILFDNNGAQTTILYRTGPQRFEGATLDGFAISFAR